MRRRTRTFLSVLSLFLLLPYQASADPRHAQDSGLGCQPWLATSALQSSGVPNPGGEPKLGVETLSGERGLEYLESLKRAHPERFSKAGASLAQAGYRPTSIVVALRLTHFSPVSAVRGLGPAGALPTTTVATSAGEVIFHSWDDGDDGTWEGSVYVERYSDGAWVLYDVQYDIETADYFEVWSEGMGGGGGGPGGDPIEARYRSDRSSGILVASLRIPDLGFILPTFPYYYGHDPFLTCLTAGAAGCAAGCTFTGPGWGPCFGACATGVVVACAIERLLGG